MTADKLSKACSNVDRTRGRRRQQSRQHRWRQWFCILSVWKVATTRTIIFIFIIITVFEYTGIGIKNPRRRDYHHGFIVDAQIATSTTTPNVDNNNNNNNNAKSETITRNKANERNGDDEIQIHATQGTNVRLGCGVEQNVGRDDPRVPSHLTLQMEEEIMEMNKYYNSLFVAQQQQQQQQQQQEEGESSSYDKYLLVRHVCQNDHELCVFWKVQNRCESIDFKDYLIQHCPLACRVCHHDDYRARQFLHVLWKQLPEQYYNTKNDSSSSGPTLSSTTATNNKKDVNESRFRAMQFILSRLDMDPTLINKPLNIDEDGNWAKELHSKLMAVIPAPLLRLYASPSSLEKTQQEDDVQKDNDIQFLMTLFGGSSNQQLKLQLVPYRNRGYVLEAMLDFDHYVTRPIQLSIGFAVPSPHVATEIASLAVKLQKKILQMGAGTGYFGTYLKQQQQQQKSNIDVIAYDLHPPSQHKNDFFEWDFSNDTIRAGACTDVISTNPSLATDSILLIVWPNDPDPIDNPQFCQDDDNSQNEDVWDVDCLKAYIDAGGRMVVYVGERSDNLSTITNSWPTNKKLPPDSGLSSTNAFQNLLKDQFHLLKTFSIPQWWLNEDDVTIWRKRDNIQGDKTEL
jgi:ShK domain-like